MAFLGTLGERIVLWLDADGQEVRLADVPYDVFSELVTEPNRARKLLAMCRFQSGVYPATIAREFGVAEAAVRRDLDECLEAIVRARAEVEPRLRRCVRGGRPPYQVLKTCYSGEYLMALTRPRHPRANRNGWYLLHRILMENHLGRVLDESEVVHHKDGNTQNNDLANLAIMSNSGHAKLHWQERIEHSLAVRRKCPTCGRFFHTTVENLDRLKPWNKRPFCSGQCYNQYLLDGSCPQKSQRIK